jgi:hypothetical protein
MWWRKALEIILIGIFLIVALAALGVLFLMAIPGGRF